MWITNISYSENNGILTNCVNSWNFPILSFFLVASTSTLLPGSSVVILPLVVLVLESSSSTSVVLNEINVENYHGLLDSAELQLQAEREIENNVSDFAAKFHNIVIVTIDLFGIYFLLASLVMPILPVTYCVEYFAF